MPDNGTRSSGSPGAAGDKMNAAEIEAAAARIIEKGNGWTIPAAELLKIPEPDRGKVWREIVNQGAAADAAAAE